jgi:hypothetical protein
MFRESSTARTYLRGFLAAAIAVASAAGTIWVDNPYAKLASVFALVLGGYLGLGAAIPQAEPFFGVKLKNAEVPPPPASKVDNEQAAEDLAKVEEYVHPRYKP